MFKQYASKIPKVTNDMYNCNYWIERDKNAKKIIMTKEEIEKYNKKNLEKEAITDIFQFKEELPCEEISSTIKSISKVPSAPRYKDGQLLKEEYFQGLEKNLGIDELKEKNSLSYGLTIRRSSLRTFPTEDRVFKSPEDYDLDRFMETAVYPCEPCMIYCCSKDKKWYFSRIKNYFGWIKCDDVAVGSKEDIMNYAICEDFIVITGRKVYTGFNPFNKDISMIPLDMGVKLPLVDEDHIEELIFDMCPCGSYVVRYPLRSEEGKLRIVQMLIPQSEDVSQGYLPYNSKNIIKQAFKLQGERYGWGGEFFSRDCSALVQDIYKTVGIDLPRNSGEQFKVAEGIGTYFTETTSKEYKKTVLDKLKIGSAIFLNGHVTIYLGKVDKEYFIIHDTIGFYIDEQKYLRTKGVVISPITCIYTSSKKQYLQEIIGTKTYKIP